MSFFFAYTTSHVLFPLTGWNDVGFHNPLVKTPNIDWLARHGLELTDMHAQPLCSP